MIPTVTSSPFTVTIYGTITLAASSPFSDTPYVLGDPEKLLSWSIDTNLGVSTADASCGSMGISFWLVDGAGVLTQEVSTVVPQLFAVDLATKNFKVLTTTDVAAVGTHKVAY